MAHTSYKHCALGPSRVILVGLFLCTFHRKWEVQLNDKKIRFFSLCGIYIKIYKI